MWRTNLRNILNNYSVDPSGEFTNVHKKKAKIIKILRKYSTPLFIADQRILQKNIVDLSESCKKKWGDFRIAYSFKTNYEVTNLKVFKKNALWAEVVSGREYRMAKKLGYKGKEIIFNGPSKTDLDLKTALIDGALVFIDNLTELARIRKIARVQKREFQIGIRLRTKIPRLDESRFGFSVDNDDAREIISQIEIDRFLNLVGVHMHIGSDIDNPERYRFAAAAMTSFIEKNISNFDTRLKYLDFGGGFPSQVPAPLGRLRWNPRHIGDYVEVIAYELNKIFKKQRSTLILEPGRYLVDDAVFFVTRITNCKNTEFRQVLTTDATISMLPLIQYRPQIVKLYDKDLNEKKTQVLKTIVYGASCRENDILYSQELPKAVVGDIVIYFAVGAYNQNMGSEFIFKKAECVSI